MTATPPRPNIYSSSTSGRDSPRLGINKTMSREVSRERDIPDIDYIDDATDNGKLNLKSHLGDSVDLCADSLLNDLENNNNYDTNMDMQNTEKEGLLNPGGSSSSSSSSSFNILSIDSMWKSKNEQTSDSDKWGKIQLHLASMYIVLGNSYQQGGIIKMGQTFYGMLASALSKIPPEYHTVMSCGCYCFCSLTMVLANKALASSYQADIGFLTIFFQAALAVVFLEIFHYYGVMKLETDPQTGSKFDAKLAKQWLPVNCFFVGMLFTGYMSLKYLNVPMVTIFKNLTNVGILFGEWFFQGKKITNIVLTSCLLMVVGAFLAATNDITFSFIGYFWMIMNCCSTASYVLYMKHATKTIQLTKNGMVYYNNLLSVPILFMGALFKGEIQTFFSNTDLLSFNYLTITLYAGFLGVFLNLATLWCVSNTSATTYAVVGALNKIPLSLAGYFLFKTPITSQSAVFISMSMFGGFLYTYGKLEEAKADKVAKLQQPQNEKSTVKIGG